MQRQLRIDKNGNGTALAAATRPNDGARRLPVPVFLRGLGWVVLSTIALASASALRAAPLKVGDDAPAFELPGSDGKTYKLSDFRNKKAVIVAWFPKALTAG